MRASERKRLTSLGFFPPLSFSATLALKFCQNSVEEEEEHIPIVIKRRTKLLLPGNQIHTGDGWAAGIRIPGVAERLGNWRRVQIGQWYRRRGHTVLVHNVVFGNPEELGGLFRSDVGAALGAELVCLAFWAFPANQTRRNSR